MGYKSTKACSKTDKSYSKSREEIKTTIETLKKTTVKEELEYWNALYIFRRLNKYFNSFHGYDRGLRGLTAEDFSMMVLEKIISGQRSWENSTRVSFIEFCYDVMKTEIYNYRHTVEYQTIKSYDLHLEQTERWDRIGLQDDFNGF
jgi:hypothetical protein